jgi:hypothetical protein
MFSVRQPARDAHAVRQVEAALLEVRAVELHRHREVIAHRAARRAHDLQQQPGAILQRPAPLVLAPVGDRRQELRQQVTVRAVHLHAGEAGLARDRRGGGEAADNVLDLARAERPRPGEQPEQLEPLAGRRHRPRRAHARTLAARVADLHPQVVAGRGAGFRPISQRRVAAPVLDDHIAGALQPAPVHHHVAGHSRPAPPAAQRR